MNHMLHNSTVFLKIMIELLTAKKKKPKKNSTCTDTGEILLYTPDNVILTNVKANIPGRIVGKCLVATQKVFGVRFCDQVKPVYRKVRINLGITFFIKLVLMADSVVEVQFPKNENAEQYLLR